MSNTLSIPKRALHDELAGRLREMIIDGRLEPGARLQERSLCEQFDVSRTPIREALKVLSAEGLIELTPNRGASVTELTLSDLAEAFPIMGALEALAGELACARMSAAQIKRVRKLHERMVGYYRAQRLKDYFRANEAIHQAIADAAGNTTLSNMLDGLSGRVRRARFRANVTPERWAEAIEEHELMMEALEGRDGQRLGEVLKQHLENKFRALQQGLTVS